MEALQEEENYTWDEHTYEMSIVSPNRLDHFTRIGVSDVQEQPTTEFCMDGYLAAENFLLSKKED